MKFHFRRPSRAQPTGFTLVELLVVIAIIAILASVILYAGTAAINAAKRAKANNMANQLQTATLGYYTEYSVYPVPSGVTTDFALTDSDGVLGGATAGSWGALVECLSGMICPYNGTTSTETTFSNTRSIAFLTLKTSDVGNGSSTGHQDAPLNPIPPSSANPYFDIAIDADYDGLIGGSDTVSGSWLPAFSPVSVGNSAFSPPSAGGGGSSTAGVAVWADCVGTSTKYNSSQWVHTY
jgi:prepilin-type N-terminal cleavage/methylation domain-containing protein